MSQLMLTTAFLNFPELCVRNKSGVAKKETTTLSVSAKQNFTLNQEGALFIKAEEQEH